MKKITFLFATLFSLVAFSQTTYTEDFSSEILAPVLQDASNPGLNDSYISAIASGDGKWFTVQGFGVTDFGIQTTGGNPANYVSRISETQFARGLAYVYNNSDNSVTGSYTLSFDYFFNTSFDNASTTNERFGYKIYGITATNPDGTFPLSSGSGDFGDNNATNYNGSDAIELVAYTHLTHTNSWASSGSISVDFGASGTYKYFVVIFGQVFGTIQTGNPVATYFGIDNVVLPTQSNPQATTLSSKGFNKSQFTVYPNPAKNEVTVKNIQGAFSYNIYNVSGKILRSVTNQVSKSISTNDLSSGLYFLEIADKNNIKSVLKLVKE